MTDILIKRGNFDTDVHTEGMSYEDKCRDRGNAFIIQGTPKIARKPPEVKGETQSRFFLAEGTKPTDTLISDFQLPELRH